MTKISKLNQRQLETFCFILEFLSRQPGATVSRKSFTDRAGRRQPGSAFRTWNRMMLREKAADEDGRLQHLHKAAVREGLVAYEGVQNRSERVYMTKQGFDFLSKNKEVPRIFHDKWHRKHKVNKQKEKIPKVNTIAVHEKVQLTAERVAAALLAQVILRANAPVSDSRPLEAALADRDKQVRILTSQVTDLRSSASDLSNKLLVSERNNRELMKRLSEQAKELASLNAQIKGGSTVNDIISNETRAELEKLMKQPPQ